MTIDFADHFWGPRNNGFEVLYQNMKYGLTATKEFIDFLKERSSLEESYSKSLLKLAKVAANANTNGTFSPYWDLLKTSSEKLSNIHLKMTQKVQELMKDLTKYSDELQKKCKTVKEEEAGTLEAVTQIQNSTAMTLKTKEMYLQRSMELEKCQKDNASVKDIEKAEGKKKKAQEEYKQWVDKYQICREDFVQKITAASKHFQEVEVSYITQMKEFVTTYADIMESNHQLVDQLNGEFRHECNQMTVEKLLEILVKAKGTGSEKPSMLVMEEIGNGDSLVRGNSRHDEKSLNGEKLSSSGSEKKKEGTVESSVDEIRASKGSRRTTSLLNLFIPLTQGNKSNISGSGCASKDKGDSPSLDASTGSGGVAGDAQVASAASNYSTSANKPTSALSRSSNRGSKSHSPVVRASQNNDDEPSSSSEVTRATKVFGFLRSRRGKKKEKKRSKKKDGASSGPEEKSEGEEKDESQKSETPTAEIDEEGYSVPPKNTWENDKSSFYSSSDSDSEDEREKRLHIEIKPLNNGAAPLSASVDELRSTVENLTLSPAGMSVRVDKSRKLLHEADSQMKRSQSVSQQIGSSSPPSRHPYTPLSPPIPPPNPRSSPKLPAIAGGNDPSTSSQSSSANRYADLGDLFAEIGDMQPTPVSNTSTSSLGGLSLTANRATGTLRNTPTPTASSTLSRPPSRPRPEAGLSQRNSGSPSPAMSRTESIGSLERSIGSHIIGSRGPSPLTLGMADTIPIAVAFHEIVHAIFKGNDESLCQVKMTGDMMVSFPAGIIQVFTNNPSPAPLSFQVRSLQPIDNLAPNNDLVTCLDEHGVLSFDFNMSALLEKLKENAEQNPTSSYFNVGILKYRITPKPGAASCPLHLVAFWKCEPSQTDLRIDYKYNSHAMVPIQPEAVPPANPSLQTLSRSSSIGAGSDGPAYPPMVQVCVAAPVDGGVKSMQSKPTGQWFPTPKRACWKIPTLSYSADNQGIGSLRARFEVSNGPSTAGTIAAQFSCEGSTLSGCDLQLTAAGYRVSLTRRRFVSGKYTCEAVDSASRYAVPPGPGGLGQP